MQREVMQYDAVIVGGGPAGLACAIRLKQLAAKRNLQLSVCILEKGAEIGAHILSGAVFEPRALDELIPDWRERGNAPLHTPVLQDQAFFLTAKKAYRLPVPPAMENGGNFIISLGNLCRWLATQAEALGVEIYPGFAAAEILYDDKGQVRGVATGDMGVARDGTQTSNYQPGVELHAKQTIFAEGCRGSLTKALMARYKLNTDAEPQVYGLGIKELWEIDPAKHRQGLVIHTVGWPLDAKTYGGGFLYHLEENQVYVGLITGLGYRNPYLSPYQEFQRFKTHPAIRDYFAGARRVSYGARAISSGGLQSLPKLHFPGGLLIGDAAGFLNVQKIKGSHTAMKSGMTAAETVFDLIRYKEGAEATQYRTRMRKTWAWEELYAARNFKPAFRWGLYGGLAHAALEAYIFKGGAPWTLHHPKADHQSLEPAAKHRAIDYPSPDGVLTFDKLTSVYLSNTQHEENQPCHLRLREPERAIEINLAQYDSPEQRYCPAGVYEILRNEGKPRLQINAANCVHCKACDIKDPTQNIDWVVPQGGDGPNYPNM
ncbi:MAG TPA: electron transfer flavoprotein-ubiquinone oxidoreductase [Burkholderiales bacterium]|nr:electron transfer flavoprotein-ubiquinone oxidoreductase [Burkholderiales bacterium]